MAVRTVWKEHDDAPSVAAGDPEARSRFGCNAIEERGHEP
jgi:hypothetical protein